VEEPCVWIAKDWRLKADRSEDEEMLLVRAAKVVDLEMVMIGGWR
jgi:hypothetical protein